MTLQLINELCKKNNIPDNVELLSDSGWECDPTDMDGVYYSKEKNTIIFTQGGEYEIENPYNDKRHGYTDLVQIYCKAEDD